MLYQSKEKSKMPLRSADKSFRQEATTGGEKVEKAIVFDPFDNKFAWDEGVTSKLDPEDNPFARLAPPPMGRYQLQCFAQKDSFKMGKNKRDGAVYYSASIECRIVNHPVADYNGAVVFPKAFYSSIGRGQKISTMAKMIDLWGYGKSLEKKEYTFNEKEITQLFAQALKREPLIWADLDWEGQFNAGTKDNPDYKVPFKSMLDFPEDEDGNPIHNPRVSDGQGGEVDINARLKVVEWIGKTNVQEGQEAIKVAAAPAAPVKAETKPNGKAKATEKVKVKEPEPEVVGEVEQAASDEELVLLD